MATNKEPMRFKSSIQLRNFRFSFFQKPETGRVQKPAAKMLASDFQTSDITARDPAIGIFCIFSCGPVNGFFH